MKTIGKLSDTKPNLKLVAVTKGHSPEEIINMLQKTGIKSIAENRLNEAEEKFPSLPPNLEKHFIGKLQSRKIKKIVELFDVIQSVENLKQADLISKIKKNYPIFILVNISGSTYRSGISISEAPKLIKEIQSNPNLKLLGVMGIASPNLKKAKQEFKILKKLQGSLPYCSMGMTQDFQIALEEGSNMLRLGTLLFQENLPLLLKFE